MTVFLAVGYFLCFIFTLFLTLVVGLISFWVNDVKAWMVTLCMVALTTFCGYATTLSWKKWRG